MCWWISVWADGLKCIPQRKILSSIACPWSISVVHNSQTLFTLIFSLLYFIFECSTKRSSKSEQQVGAKLLYEVDSSLAIVHCVHCLQTRYNCFSIQSTDKSVQVNLKMDVIILMVLYFQDLLNDCPGNDQVSVLPWEICDVLL